MLNKKLAKSLFHCFPFHLLSGACVVYIAKHRPGGCARSVSSSKCSLYRFCTLWKKSLHSGSAGRNCYKTRSKRRPKNLLTCCGKSVVLLENSESVSSPSWMKIQCLILLDTGVYACFHVT